MTSAAKTCLLVRNPTAGRRRRRLVPAIARSLRAAGWTVDVADTQAAGDARRIAATCDAARYSVIAVAGGDGTINEAVNGLMSRADAGVPLAVVPLGTANVLARELGLAFSAAGITTTIMSGRELAMQPGIAIADGPARHFSLMVGTGFDARVVAGVTSELKRRWGKLAYVWRSLIEALRYRPVRYLVEIDGKRHVVASVIVTRARFYAGSYVVAPEATLAVAKLHVCLFERWGRLAPLRFGLALLMGWLPRLSGYRVVTGNDVRISVEASPTREPVQIDGDDALGLPVSIGLAPRAVRLLRPVHN
jgi:diacylglycerol kinase family enzyme